MIAVLCLLVALLGNAMAAYVPTYGLPVAGYPGIPVAGYSGVPVAGYSGVPVAGYPGVPAVTSVHAAPVAALQAAHQAVPVSPTVHNVATPYGYRTTGVSYSHRVDALPVRARYAYGLAPFGLGYGYGLGAYGYPTVLKK